jgi:hypothetical protein
MVIEDRQYFVVEDAHAPLGIAHNRLLMHTPDEAVSFMEPRGFADEAGLAFAKFEHCAQLIEDVLAA